MLDELVGVDVADELDVATELMTDAACDVTVPPPPPPPPPPPQAVETRMTDHNATKFNFFTEPPAEMRLMFFLFLCV